MYLKRLEIQGFKSFATKTVLDFLPPKDGLFSITGIVGPNGAGKSNITDAIRWVMGETSLKQVRAKKSEDVIFNGSESKGSLGAAEVTMTLENAEGDTGLDFPEIVLTRRLYRTGESEYLVNNNSARLIDIHLLLAKAKFAEGAYSIVSQGMIDRLLTVTPAERKDFFDEACGIKEHQIKQHQAMLKLARTEENSRQAFVVLQEVEPHLKILGKQVKKLEKRQEVEAELNDAQEKYYATLYTKNKIDSDVIRGELSVIEKHYRTAFYELEVVQRELSELARGSTRQEVFAKLQSRYQVASASQHTLERELAVLEGQLQMSYSEAGEHKTGWLETKVAELKGASESARRAAEAALQEAESAVSAATAIRRESDELNIEHTQYKVKIARLESDLLKDQSERSYREVSGLTAVKAVLEARQRFGGKVYGVVAELGVVDNDYRLALDVAAGNHLSSIVVENETVARRAIEYLRENRFGVATFLPLSRIEGRFPIPDIEALLKENSVLGRAEDLIRFDEKFATIFSLVLGNTLVVKDLKTAERLGIQRARLVTLDGDLVEQKGVMRGGFRSRSGLTFGMKMSLTGDERLEEIQSAVTVARGELLDIEKRVESKKAELMEKAVAAESKKHRAELLETEFKKVEQELSRMTRELELLTSSPEKFNARRQELAGEKKRLIKASAARGAEIQTIEAEMQAFNAEEETKRERVFALQDTMQKRQEEVNAALNDRSNCTIELAKLETRQEDLAQEVQTEMKTSLQSLALRASATVPTEEIAGVADAIQRLKYQLSLIGGIDEEVVKEYADTKQRYDFLTGQLADLTKATNDLQTMIAELDELMKKRRAEAFKKIRKDFDRYFKILFGGGTAGLEEVYGEVAEETGETSPNPSFAKEGGYPLASAEERAGGEVSSNRKGEKVLTGIEVMANPPGKKVKYLNMLSGGERTLTSIALISAILFHNPSPFVVLDEVEAALDEANTMRFVKILGELSTHCQFIVVTHNRVTMHAMSALYGVVMGVDGVSKLLSVTMADAPQYADGPSVDK
ncbi:MAG: chromosome segregation protein SMC [Candidatus Magasanikbacteria bacterium]|nr:chromosome segregation protein SMC [Candidatus Magasanikbacteria bacterium]